MRLKQQSIGCEGRRPAGWSSRRVGGLLLGVSVCVMNLVVGACSSSSDAGPSTADEDVEQETLYDRPSRPSMRVLVGNDAGAWKTVYFPVLKESSGAGAPGAGLWQPQSKTASHAPSSNGLRTRSLVDEPIALGDAGYWPVLAAGAECGMLPIADDIVPDPHGYHDSPLLPSTETWFVFDEGPSSCDDVTRRVSVLTCMAGKLEDLATSLTPVRWERAETLNSAAVPGWEMPEGPWIIPPLAAESRVVVRSLARLTLAYVAKELSADVQELDDSCATLYGSVLDDPDVLNDPLLASAIFGSELDGDPKYPPLSGEVVTLTAANAQQFAYERLLVLTNALRAGSRLLDANVSEAVQDDLGQAEHKRAMATDLIEGNAAAWGLRPDGSAPKQESKKYGTYGHALRVLTGRLEMGSGVPQPQCGTVASALDVVEKANGASSGARVTFPKPTTPEQEAALCMVEAAGVVFPHPESADISGENGIRDTLAAQSKHQAAVASGVNTSDPDAMAEFNASETATLVESTWKGLSDGALRMALEATAHEYAMLTDTAPSDVNTVACGDHGLTCAASFAPEVTSAGGIVLERGIPKGELTIDSKARSLGMAVEGQCPSDFTEGVGDMWKPEEEASPQVYSNPFALAQRFAQHLTQIREVAAEIDWAGVPEPTKDLEDTEALEDGARAAVAEIDAWAGRSQVTLTTEPDGAVPSNVGTIEISIGGVVPEDLGIPDDVADPAAIIQEQFALVYGGPSAADCVAGLRKSCEPDVLAIREHGPSEPAMIMDLRFSPESRKGLGMDGFGVMLRFTSESATADGSAISYNDTSGNLLYLVQKHDPLAPTARGKVLAAFAIPAAEMGVTAPISPKLDSLVGEITGIASEWGVDGCRIGTPSPGLSATHCAGVPRNQTVSLENELMEAAPGDELEKSWRYWLNRAKESASQTDTLARQMIEEGLQKDLRREAAQENLASLCGSYAAAGKIEFNDYGRIKKPEPGSNLESCLDEEKHPIVFLTTMPDDGQDATWVKRNILFCEDQTGQPLAGASNPLCKLSDFSKNTALNLAEPMKVDSADSMPCDELRWDGMSIPSGFSGTHTGKLLANERWFAPDQIGLSSRSMRVVVDGFGDWHAYSRGLRIMDSSVESGLFPGCLRSNAQACDPAMGGAISLLSFAFRQPGAFASAFQDTVPCGGEFPVTIELPIGGWYCAKALGGLGDATMNGLVADEPEELESMLILWRVQGAAWMLGGLDGAIPAEMFRSPLPVADFNASWTDISGLVERRAPPHAAYYTSQLTRLFPTEPQYTLTSSTNLMGTVIDIEDKLKWPWSPEIPEWIWEPFARAAIVPGDRSYKVAYRDSAEQVGDHTTMTRDDFINYVFTLTGAQCSQMHGGSGYLPQRSMKLRLKHESGILCTDAGCNAADWNVGGGCSEADTPYGDFCGTISAVRYDGCGPTAYSWRPEDRVLAAVNSYPPNGACGRVALAYQTSVLACVGGSLPWSFAAINNPPEIHSLEDIASVEGWIWAQSQRAREILSSLYIENLPTRVVQDIASGRVGTGTKDGTHGRLVLELSPALIELVNGWLGVERELAGLAAAVRNARSRIAVANTEARIQSTNIAIAQLNITSAMVAQASSALSAFSSGNLGGGMAQSAGTVVQTGILAQQKELTDSLGVLQDTLLDETIGVALADLGAQTTASGFALQQALNTVASSTARATSLAAQIRQAERDAQYAAAKAKGEPFVVVDGEPVAIPVNAVLNRQFQITKQRYDRSLAESKYLAFIARLAIERRIGRPLDDLNTEIGPVEAPSLWADDVCDMTGLDYQNLSEVDTTMFSVMPFPASPDDEMEFGLFKVLTRDVSPFIGDYVNKLELFVDAYNIAFPFQQGDDTAVLSIRDDVLAQHESCVVASPNLLLFSHDLELAQAALPGESFVGWARSACESGGTRCVEAKPGAELGTPPGVTPATYSPIPPGGVGGTGATWLREMPEVDTADWTGPTSDIYGVSQVVSTQEPGTYILSWWDQARRRTDLGAFPEETDPQVAYRVEVRDELSSVVAAFSDYPFRPDASNPELAAAAWSDRRELRFELTEPGSYTVTFAPSLGSGELGSVVIANTQLEAVGSMSAMAGAYYGTGSTAETIGRCPSLSPGELRSAFQRACNADGECYYELTEPLSINAEQLATQNGYLGGNFARGNYNFRHITVALNLAGTSLIDCAANPTNSCYGDGTIRYTLEHNAVGTEVIAGIWQGELEKHRFNFGTGAIRNGQALAAERFITSPVGSADMSLLSQPGILKTEFLGRPLGGTYRLRIWETPALMWDRLEDVQIVLKYRYWSAVQP